jgi:hypothetical protein
MKPFLWEIEREYGGFTIQEMMEAESKSLVCLSDLPVSDLLF